MKLVKHIFFDTEENEQGHCSIYEKDNGNTYITFFIEEKYFAFREYNQSKKIINGCRKLGFKILNKQSYDKNFKIIIK